MDEFNLKNIPNIHFIFDFKVGGGYLPFGYNKYTLPNIIQTKLSDLEDEGHTGYYPSLEEPSIFHHTRASAFSTYINEYTPKTSFCLTHELLISEDDGGIGINSKDYYIVVIEALNVNNLFEYYSHDDFIIENMISPNLIELIKNNENFKIVFMDSREGAYPHDIQFLENINDFLDRNEINHLNKVVVSTNNNFINNLTNDISFEKFKNRIVIYPNNYCLLTAGRFVGEMRVYGNSLVENGYEFSIQQDLNLNDKQKYFLMYNRNSERMHRAWFVNELYKENLIDKGFISFFENPYFDMFLENSKEYTELGLNEDDIDDIRTKYKNYYPLTIDDTDSERVANYHNFLSRKDEYEKSYFTIVSETNAESDYCFITEKTVKPIMNLHPFLVLGNPHTLKVLKSYGFRTFDKWWDESYDNEFDFKTRAKMVFNIVKSLCSKTFEDWNLMIQEMEEDLVFNKRLLHKLTTKKQYQLEFIKNIL